MLRELCMPFEVVVSEGRDTLPQMLPANAKLPLLTDEGEIFEGPENIINHLNYLQKFKEQWYKYQSDVCYCDENGNVE
jgi:hypothetical protein